MSTSIRYPSPKLNKSWGQTIKSINESLERQKMKGSVTTIRKFQNKEWKTLKELIPKIQMFLLIQGLPSLSGIHAEEETICLDILELNLNHGIKSYYSNFTFLPESSRAWFIVILAKVFPKTVRLRAWDSGIPPKEFYSRIQEDFYPTIEDFFAEEIQKHGYSKKIP